MIIFDLDGTLINSEHFLKKIEAELKSEMGISISLDEQIKRFGGIGPYQQLELDPSLPAEFAPEAEKRFRMKAEGELLACPGVVDFLKSYKGEKVIASNGPLEWIEMATKVTGLNSFFKDTQLFHVGLVENKKPAPDLFLLAAGGLSHEKVRVVEDSSTGVKAGVAAGFKTFGFVGASPRPLQLKEELLKAGASTVFEHFDSLAGLL